MPQAFMQTGGTLVPALIAYARCLHLLGIPSVRLIELGVRWFNLP